MTKVSVETCFTVVDLGEGQGLPSFWVRKKKSQKEENPAGQAKQKCPPPLPSLAQGLDIDPSLFYKLKRFIVFKKNLTEIMLSFHSGA